MISNPTNAPFRNEVKTVVQEVPEESCQMAPRKDCSMETQIIPSLEAVEECVDVPKEICSMVQVNPRVERNPVVKKWCGPAELVGSGGKHKCFAGLMNQCRTQVS